MLAVDVIFLTGRYVATAHHDRATAEWPPHPARFFSALVATWADVEDPDRSERTALEWLEAQPPPAIAASDAISRKVVSHFVPVNDASVISRSPYMNRYTKTQALQKEMATIHPSDAQSRRRLSQLKSRVQKQRNVDSLTAQAGKTQPARAMALFPEHRVKQERVYPSVTPLEPRITYIWDSDAPTDIAEAMDGLLGRVTRLGHSSSLVACRRLLGDAPSPTYTPGDGGTKLRAVRRGQLAALEREYDKHQASRPRSLPFLSTSYRVAPPPLGTQTHLRPDTAGEMILFEFAPKSRKVPSIRTADLSALLRATTLHYAQNPLPERLSGHQSNGLPSTRPHVGFLALPWVGSAHSDGRIMGVAIGIPHSLDAESRRALLRAVGKWEESAEQKKTPLYLNFGGAGRLQLQRIVGVSELVTLRPWVWHKANHRWASVTPIALPTHPGPLGRGTAAARAKAWIRAEHSVVDACRHIGLPEPVDITLSFDPLIAGVRPAHQFPAFRQGAGRGRPVARRLLHASVTFEQPVEGPLVLGAGRYLGLGLMRPVPKRSKPGEEEPK